MEKIQWFDRRFVFGMSAGLLPFILDRLDGTLARLEKKVLSVNDKVLSEKLEGKWSVKQNIGHLAELEVISVKRFGEIISGASELCPAVFEPHADYNAISIREVLNLFDSNRKRNIALYDKVSDGDLLKTSLHPRLKVKMNPVDLAFFHAEHDDHHLVRINEILQMLAR